MVTHTINPDKDAEIRAAQASTNFGSTEYLTVAQMNATNGQRRALLEFDISAIIDVPIDFISSCTLNIYDSGSTDPRTIDFRKIDNDTWTESGVTWDNQPYSWDFNLEDNWSSGWNSRSIISILKSALRSGHSYVGILLKYTDESYDGSLDANVLRSKESSWDPYLTITYSTYSQTNLKGGLCKNITDIEGWGEITMTDHNCPSPCDAATFTFKTAWGSTYTSVILDVGDTQQYDSGSMHHSFKLYSMSATSAACDNLAAATIEEKYWEDDCYVKTTGDNDRNGTSWTEAWDTVTQAATEAFDGQEVHIDFGTYSGESKVTPDNFGTTGIKYTPESVGGGGTGSVTIPL